MQIRDAHFNARSRVNDLLENSLGIIECRTQRFMSGNDFVQCGLKRVSIEFDGRFGNAKALVRQISGQHAHYVTALASGQG